MLPKVSVVVCTYNRAKYISTTLEHLSNQSADSAEYDVLIVDNNSTDNTATLAKKFIDTNETSNFQYFLEENQGHSHARNRGIKESSSPIISFIDDDAFVSTNFIENIISFFDSHATAQAIGGKIIPKYETSEPKWMSKYLLPLVAAIDMGSEVKKFKSNKFPIGANMAYRRDVFEKLGSFNVELGRKGLGLEGGDEKDLFMRMKFNNMDIYYVPDVVVDHIIPEKRLQMDYIHGLATGVGTSEKKRLKDEAISKKLAKVVEESIKVLATIVLFLGFSCTLQFQKALMLVRFRIWVLKGFMS